MLSCGLRVVRGPNWSWENQDGGEGYVGTVRDINLPGTPPKTVVVHWDNGSQLNCRIGYQDKFDLRVIDNAQIGARHRHICDGCDKNISGMRYHCTSCHDYDLCYMCYHGDKHNLSHPFKRFDEARSAGVNVPPRFNARKCELQGIFKGAKVVRGFDWQWDNQDGKEGNGGIVVDIRGWERKSYRSTANVQWVSGNTDIYRIGHKGYCDIQCVEPSSGGQYYPEHLPVLGQSDEEMEWNGILDTIDRQQIMFLESNGLNVEDHATNNKYDQDSTLVGLNPTESSYASVIIDHNKGVTATINPHNEIGTASQRLNLLDKFCKITPVFKDEEIKEMWDMIQYMINLPPVSSENAINARYSDTFIKKLILQGKRFLEDRYKIYMENTVKENISQLPQNDTPGLYSLVHNFVALRFKGEYLGLHDGMVDNCPLWPMVYYCLRSGDIPAAIYCLRDRHVPEIKEITSLLKMRLEEPINPEIDISEENIRIAYQSVIRNCSDPFKRIVWAILGCFNEISEASKTADDYLWFKLNLAHVDCTGGGYIKYSDLQSTLLEEQGESHFDAFNHPHLYFKLLILTGQFEAAIEFLFRTEKFKIHSVHMAIALNELNLLALPQDINSSLISIDSVDPKPARHLNLVLLIKNYVEKFENCPNASLNYLFLLRNFSNTEGKNIFEVYVADLVIKTKQYVTILGHFERSSALGKRRRNLYRTNGLIDQFNMPDIFKTVVLEIKTQIMTKNKNWEELVDFYNTVDDQESVLHFMCTMLSKVAHLENQPGSLRSKLQNKASRISERYCTIGYDGHQRVFESFMKARNLLTFFDQYREKRYLEALRILAVLQIVPLKVDELQKAIDHFHMLNEDLMKVVPHLLLAAMTILIEQCVKIKRTASPNQQHIRWVWQQANTLTNFAESLPKEIIGDIPNRLVQMEILLHS